MVKISRFERKSFAKSILAIQRSFHERPRSPPKKINVFPQETILVSSRNPNSNLGFGEDSGRILEIALLATSGWFHDGVALDNHSADMYEANLFRSGDHITPALEESVEEGVDRVLL